MALTILIVENDISWQIALGEIFVEVMAELGYKRVRVLQADCLRAAREHLKNPQEKIDLVSLDIVLGPHERGDALLESLKRREPAIRVLLIVSGAGEHELVGLRGDVAEVLRKTSIVRDFITLKPDDPRDETKLRRMKADIRSVLSTDEMKAALRRATGQKQLDLVRIAWDGAASRYDVAFHISSQIYRVGVGQGHNPENHLTALLKARVDGTDAELLLTHGQAHQVKEWLRARVPELVPYRLLRRVAGTRKGPKEEYELDAHKIEISKLRGDRRALAMTETFSLPDRRTTSRRPRSD